MKGKALQLGMAGPEMFQLPQSQGLWRQRRRCLKPYIACGGQGREFQEGNTGAVSSFFALPKHDL